MSSIRVRDPREGKIMKITKAEGYKKPNYAVAVAAAMVTVAVTGCGTPGADLAGAATVYTPPEEEIQLAGDVSVEQMNNVIDYDGGIEMYTNPVNGCSGKEVDLPEERCSKEYCEPIDDVLVLAGDISVCDPAEDNLVLDGGAPVYEP